MNLLSSCEEIDLNKLVDDKIQLGNQLQKRFAPFIHIDGAIKIQRKIGREIKYLEKVGSTSTKSVLKLKYSLNEINCLQAKCSGKIQHNNVLCSNLPNYECLINTLYSCRNIKSLDYPIHLVDREFPLRIDIICDNGSTWVKGFWSFHEYHYSFIVNVVLTVIARNPKSLSDTAQGRSGRFGTKTILDQAAEFVQAAEENQCFFRTPNVSE